MEKLRSASGAILSAFLFFFSFFFLFFVFFMVFPISTGKARTAVGSLFLVEKSLALCDIVIKTLKTALGGLARG